MHIFEDIAILKWLFLRKSCFFTLSKSCHSNLANSNCAKIFLEIDFLMFNNIYMEKTLRRVPISWYDRLKIDIFESQVYYSQAQRSPKNSERNHVSELFYYKYPWIFSEFLVLTCVSEKSLKILVGWSNDVSMTTTYISNFNDFTYEHSDSKNSE